jgi:transcriptional regulator with XRE-family HTH domain
MNQINILRSSRGLSLMALSAKAGVPYSNVQRLDANPALQPRLGLAMKLADALGVTVGDIFEAGVAVVKP